MTVKKNPDVPEEEAKIDASDQAAPPEHDARDHDHDDELVDEQGRESFPGSDPPGNY